METTYIAQTRIEKNNQQPPRCAISNGTAGNSDFVSSGFPAAIFVKHQAASSNCRIPKCTTENVRIYPRTCTDIVSELKMIAMNECGYTLYLQS